MQIAADFVAGDKQHGGSNSVSLMYHMKEHGFTVLGAGMFSTVLAHGTSDWVFKAGSCQTWEPYVVWALENGFAGSFAPRVHEFHRVNECYYYAVMERLHTTVSRVAGEEQELDRILGHRMIADTSGMAELEKRFPGLTCFAKQAIHADFAGDWHNANWMFADKEHTRLVLIDPQSGNRAPEIKRWRPAGIRVEAVA